MLAAAAEIWLKPWNFGRPLQFKGITGFFTTRNNNNESTQRNVIYVLIRAPGTVV